MKQWIHADKKSLIAGGVCLLLALTLVLSALTALRAPRKQPEAPEKKTYPGLNIDQIGLRYDTQTEETGAGGGDNGEGQAQREELQPPEETPPEQQESVEPEQQEPPEENTEDPADGDTGEEEETNEDEEQKDEEKEEDPAEPTIATDLRNRTVSENELKNGLFAFTASVLNGSDDTYLRVKIKNSGTKGRQITASGDNYTTKLAVGRNEITLLLKRGTEIIGEVTYVINYRPAVADEEDPEKGENPPTIRTNLSGDVIEMTNRNLTFTVWATDGENNPIHQNNITVKLDGKEVKYSTGSGAGGLEYNLFLEAGSIGSSTRHTVTIQAWDDKGNSAFKSYIIDYQTTDKGEKIGTATIRLDLSVLGLGIIEAPVTCDIFQDVPASYAIKEVLENLGYNVSFSGTLDNGFYLSRISRDMYFESAEIPAELKKLLEKDGLSVTPPKRQVRYNSVGEFDYTAGSGWMYAVNGVYPGRGMSEYFLSDGDTLTLRFTLARGKDIGDSGAGRGYGNLPSYCGTWIDGSYIPRHSYSDGKCTVCGEVDPDHTHQETETATVPATCTEDGQRTYTCSICGETHTETIPAAGHHYENGVCTGCGQADPNAKPEPDPEPKPDPEPTPGPTPDPEPEPGGEETQNEETA